MRHTTPLPCPSFDSFTISTAYLPLRDRLRVLGLPRRLWCDVSALARRLAQLDRCGWLAVCTFLRAVLIV